MMQTIASEGDSEDAPTTESVQENDLDAFESWQARLNVEGRKLERHVRRLIPAFGLLTLLTLAISMGILLFIPSHLITIIIYSIPVMYLIVLGANSIFVRQSTRRLLQIAKEIVELKDTPALESAISMISNKESRNIAIKVLPELLLTITEKDISRLNENRRNILYETLIHSSQNADGRDRTPELALAILGVLEYITDEKALSCLRVVVKEAKNEEVRFVARNRLIEMAYRVEQQSRSRDLLRPSDVIAQGSHSLLLPLQGTPSKSQDLLRGSDPPEDTIINRIVT